MFLLENGCQIRKLLGSRSVFGSTTGQVRLVTAASIYNMYLLKWIFEILFYFKFWDSWSA